MNKYNKVPYSKVIEKRVVQGVKGGVSLKTIMASCADLQNCPATYVTFMKLYGTVIEKTKAEMIGAVGEKVYKQALEGDFKSQEFYLKSKGGWSPSTTVNEVDQEVDPDEDDGAIDALMAKLGKKRSKEEGDVQ